MDLLMRYDWPGNVRELRNLVERLVFLGPRGQVDTEALIPHLEGTPTTDRHLPVATHKSPEQSERELIYFALLDLKREVADLRSLIEVGGGETATRPLVRPIYQVDDGPDAAEYENGDRGDEGGNGAVGSLKELERDAIVRALQQVDHNRRKAAELLGIGERTLYRKLDEYGLK